MSVFEKIFGTHSDHEIRRIMPLVRKIESLRESMQALSDAELRAKTAEYKERLAAGETLTIFCRRHTRPSVRLRNGRSAWSTSRYS